MSSVALAHTTTSPIRSWRDGYRTFRERIGDVRGWIELDGDSLDRRWPRSIGRDVLLIVAFVDDELQRVNREVPTSVIHRWSACKADLVREALNAPLATYVYNRSFWNCFATVCAILHTEDWPVPPQARWSALIAQLVRPRNAKYFYMMTKIEPPFRHLGATDAWELFWRQRIYFASLRGSDDRDPPPGRTGMRLGVPRTLNGDVVQIADFWARLLNNPKVTSSHGHSAMMAMWKPVFEKVQKVARVGDPKAIYLDNQTLWHTLGPIAHHTAPGWPDVEGVQQFREPDLSDAATDVVNTIGDIGRGARDIAVGVARGVGQVAGRGLEAITVGTATAANKGVRALLGGLTGPLLIGGGAVLAFVLLRRNQPQRAG